MKFLVKIRNFPCLHVNIVSSKGQNGLSWEKIGVNKVGSKSNTKVWHS